MDCVEHLFHAAAGCWSELLNHSFDTMKLLVISCQQILQFNEPLPSAEVTFKLLPVDFYIEKHGEDKNCKFSNCEKKKKVFSNFSGKSGTMQKTAEYPL